jgi:hypothetical protein
MQQHRSSPEPIKRHPLILLTVDGCILIAIVMGWFIGLVLYAVWYEETMPVAPVPENSRLLSRDPKPESIIYPYYSATARYWYYARYTTTTPYNEVIEFYKDRYVASPFGTFSTDILPPATVTFTEDNHQNRIKREDGDPPNETIILAEVNKTPTDENELIMIWFYSIPVMFLAGLGIIIYRHFERMRARKAPALTVDNAQS